MYEIIKRCLDFICSFIALICFLPFFLVIFFIIKLDSKGPVFFIHERLGKGGKKIKIYKFRTMVDGAESIMKTLPNNIREEYEKNFKLNNDPRVTKAGAFLRETSLDELPQLINILKGDMSIVGPRPIVEKELLKYGPYDVRLLTVKPGLTGYWQVNGRSNTSYDERVSLDMEYIDKRCLIVDFTIILKTLRVVFKKTGAR